jgi:hypothetical protein
MSGKTFIMEGVLLSIGRGAVQQDGEPAGELIGPEVQGNPYRLDLHEWVPFERAIARLAYRSLGEHARSFDNWSAWFRDGLVSRFYTKRASKLGLGAEGDKVFAEGVVFHNLRRKAEGKIFMAKLRRDMFAWYYSHVLAIDGYDKAGRDEIEDQAKFD